jgi:hypothetical protein
MTGVAEFTKQVRKPVAKAARDSERSQLAYPLTH